MIIGIGIDIVAIDRFQRVWESYRERFLHRIYTFREQVLAQNRSNALLYFAALFAAKEAASKALGTGMRGVGWREIEIRHEPSGKPFLVFHGRAKRRFHELGAQKSHVSLSHEKDYAVAMVLLEGD